MRELAKSFIKTGTGTAGSIIFGTVAIKILAATLGPAGVGLFSLMRQILLTVLSIATLSGQTALVQGGASSSKETRLAYLGAVLRIYIVSATIASVAIFVLAPIAAERILGRTDSQAIAMIRFLA